VNETKEHRRYTDTTNITVKKTNPIQNTPIHKTIDQYSIKKVVLSQIKYPHLGH